LESFDIFFALTMLARRLTTKFSTKSFNIKSIYFSNITIHNTDINKTSNEQTTKPNNFPIVNFNDASVIFKSKTMYQLIIARVIFTICQIKPLVNYSEFVLNKSYDILGEKFTNSLLRSSFFSHFCGGESEKSIQPTVDYLQRNGVGSILDYAAESEIPAKETVENEIDDKTKMELHENEIVGRVYDYVDEARCDMHLETFRQCILSVKAVSPTGFAAIKMTALGNPVLLERMSSMLTELKLLFQKFDPRNTGYVTRDDFILIYRKHFKGGVVEDIYDSIDIDRDGIVDYIEWTDALKVEVIQDLIDHCHDNEALVKASLDKNELILVKRMRERISELAQLAKSLNVRLMIDAEHTYFQPAIDNITINLAETFNISYPVIFSTYQMYLKDSRLRLFTDIDRAKKGNYKFAAKLVRGAYMVHERARAIEYGYGNYI
jgi:proline dehydrogenase